MNEVNGRYCNRFIVIGMGFQQKQTKPSSNGIVTLAAKIRKTLHQRHLLYSTLTRVVRWNADVKELAASIESVAVKHPKWTPESPRYNCKVEIYAFSWGCGRMAKGLIKQLKKLGIQVRMCVFSDPVYYSRFLNNRWMALLPKWSLLKKLILRIPIEDNVEQVFKFFQRNSVPSGFELKLATKRTLYEERDISKAGYNHNDMDNAVEFHKRVIDCVSHISKVG